VVTEYEVLRSVELAPAAPETASAGTPRDFFEAYIDDLLYEPGEVVLLSSTPDGRGVTCSDDLVRIETSGFIFEHDYRSPDRSSILSLEPINVSKMFVAGSNWLRLTLTDLTPDRYSASPYFLVWIEPPSLLPPPAAITPLTSPTMAPTATAAPTATSTVVPTRAPTATPPAVSSPPPVATSSPSAFQPRHILLGLALFVGAIVLALLARSIINRPRLAGVLKINQDGEFWKVVDLSSCGQEVTVGREGQIKLDDDKENPTIPTIVARLIAQRDADGILQVIWQNAGDDLDLEANSHRLNHGDVEVIDRYRVVYENFGQTETAEDLLDGGIWNEI
jgi:hypothetical protein